MNNSGGEYDRDLRPSQNARRRPSVLMQSRWDRPGRPEWRRARCKMCINRSTLNSPSHRQTQSTLHRYKAAKRKYIRVAYGNIVVRPSQGKQVSAAACARRRPQCCDITPVHRNGQNTAQVVTHRPIARRRTSAKVACLEDCASVFDRPCADDVHLVQTFPHLTHEDHKLRSIEQSLDAIEVVATEVSHCLFWPVKCRILFTVVIQNDFKLGSGIASRLRRYRSHFTSIS